MDSKKFINRCLEFNRIISEKKKVVSFLNDEIEELKSSMIRYSIRNAGELTNLESGSEITIKFEGGEHRGVVKELLFASASNEGDQPGKVYISVKLMDDKIAFLPALPEEGVWGFA